MKIENGHIGKRQKWEIKEMLESQGGFFVIARSYVVVARFD